MIKKIILVLVLILGFSGIVFSSENIDFEKIKENAEQGHMDAQHRLWR